MMYMPRIICVLTLILLVGNQVSAESTILSHWSFEKNENGKLLDKQGRHNGVFKGECKDDLIHEGLDGNAIKFNNGLNYIEVPHSSDLSASEEFAVEMLIKPFTIRGYNTILWKGDRYGYPDLINYYIDIHDGKVEFKAKDKAGKWSVATTAEPVVSIGKWYNIFILWNRGNVAIYVNGKKAKVAYHEKRFATSALLENDCPVYIGRGENPMGDTFYNYDGLIDDITIYRNCAAVTPEVIKTSEKRRLSLLRQRLLKELDGNQTQITKLKKFIKLEKDPEQLDKCENNILALNDCLLETVKESELVYNYRNFFERNSTSVTQPFIISCMPSSERLVKRKEVINGIKECKTSFQLDLAKNEYEGFQTVLWGNPEVKPADIKIQVGEFLHQDQKSKLPENAIKYGWIKSIKTTKPDIPVSFVGDIPDAIMEGDSRVAVEKADFTPVFFRFYAADKTEPGIYTGDINFSSGAYQQKVRVTLRVRNFVIPVKKSIKMVFSFFESNYQKWYGYKKLTEQQKMYIYKFLLSYGITPNNIYSSAPSYPSIPMMKKLVPLGANYCNMKYVTGNKALPEDKLQKELDGFKKIITQLKQNNLFDDTYFYAFDELSAFTKQMAYAKQLMPLMRKQFPELKCLQTSFPEKKFEDMFNAWCPLWSYFARKDKLEYLKKFQERGDEIWWYSADSPTHPMPNFFLDYPVFDSRIIMTLSYMYKVKGVLYWCINREWSTNLSKGPQWPQVPWKSYIINYFSKRRVLKNGMGNFVYPGPNGQIYPSLRLENLRDGVEDYEYLTLLKKLVAKARNKDSNSSLVKDAEMLLTVPANVATAVNNYSSNPGNLLKYRQDVADMIERLVSFNENK